MKVNHILSRVALSGALTLSNVQPMQANKNHTNKVNSSFPAAKAAIVAQRSGQCCKIQNVNKGGEDQLPYKAKHVEEYRTGGIDNDRVRVYLIPRAARNIKIHTTGKGYSAEIKDLGEKYNVELHINGGSKGNAWRRLIGISHD